MQPFQHIVYFDNEEAVSPATHEKINRERVNLCKPVIYLRWKVEKQQHACSVPTHQGVENNNTQLR